MINIIDFIEKNIHKLTIEHIKNYADKNNIVYTEKEINLIYKQIMNHYKELITGNTSSLEEIKERINPTLYSTLLNLYYEYKQKYI